MILLALVAAEVAALVLAVVHALGGSRRGCSANRGGSADSPMVPAWKGARLGSSFATSNEAAKEEVLQHQPRGTIRDRQIGADCGRGFIPIVALIAFALLNDIAIECLHLALAGASKPFAGWHRTLYHCETGLVLGWPAALAVAAWRAFGVNRSTGPLPIAAHPGALFPTDLGPSSPNRFRGPSTPAARRGSELPVQVGTYVSVLARATPGRAILLAWWLALAAMAGAFPLPRGWTQPVLHAWQLACVAVALAAVARSWRSTWSRAAVCVGVLVAVELTIGVLGAWGHDAFTQWDELARVPYTIGFLTVAGLHVAWLRRPAYPPNQ